MLTQGLMLDRAATVGSLRRSAKLRSRFSQKAVTARSAAAGPGVIQSTSFTERSMVSPARSEAQSVGGEVSASSEAHGWRVHAPPAAPAVVARAASLPLGVLPTAALQRSTSVRARGERRQLAFASSLTTLPTPVACLGQALLAT